MSATNNNQLVVYGENETDPKSNNNLQMVVYNDNDDNQNKNNTYDIDDDEENNIDNDESENNSAIRNAPKKKKKKSKPSEQQRTITEEEENRKKGCLERLLPPASTSEENEKKLVVQDPHKQYRIQKQIFFWTLVSVTFGFYSVFDCEFVKLGVTDDEYIDLKGRGIWTESMYNDLDKKLGCLRYDPEMPVSRSLMWSRFFGTFFTGLIFIAFMAVIQWYMFAASVIKRRFMHFVLQVTYPAAFFMNVLMCYKLNGIEECNADDAKCAPGYAGILAVVNCLILLFLTVVICLVPPPQQVIFLVNENLPKFNTEDAKNVNDDKGKNDDDHNNNMEKKKPKKKKKEPSDNGNDQESYKPKKDDVVETTFTRVPGGMKKTHYITHADGTKSVEEEFVPSTKIV